MKPTAFETLNTKARQTMGIKLQRRETRRHEQSNFTDDALNLSIETMSNASHRQGYVYNAICDIDDVRI